MATSQNGWQANDRSVISASRIPGTNTVITMRDGDVMVVLTECLRRFHLEVEPLDGPGVMDDWGYAERPVRGSTTDLSNHASGTAADANATRHPLSKVGTFSRRQVDAIHAILRDLEGVVRWGGDYSGRKDEMHFEINAGPTAVGRVAAKVRAAAYGFTVTRPPVFGGIPMEMKMRLLVKGDSGPDVGLLQAALNVEANVSSGGKVTHVVDVDDDFGEVTDARVRALQNGNGLDVDGKAGPQTWGVLSRAASR
jgi:hypothetical protein